MSHPVETNDRTGKPWWIAVLAVIAIALGIWLVLGLLDDDDDEGEVDDPAAGQVEEDADADADADALDDADADADADAAGPLTDVLLIIDPADANAVVGQQVELTSVAVQAVVGDKTFWVGPSSDQQVFVFLEEESDPAGVEGMVNVEPGQQVTITGTVEQLPADAQQQFDLSQEYAADLEGEELYIRATSVEVVEG